MFLNGLGGSKQCILIDISISYYQFLLFIYFVDVKINLIQCLCQCLAATGSSGNFENVDTTLN